MKIRAARAADWAQIRQICCDTASPQSSMELSRQDFFAEQWVGPYESLWPEWTWVLIDESREDEVLGYLTGCPSTREHLFKKKFFDLNLLFSLFFYRWNGDTKRFLKRTLALDEGPEEKFGKFFREKLFRQYPAHLHMNFKAGVRGGGWGKKIIDVFVEELNEAILPRGIHLFCGDSARGFYFKAGFSEEKKIEFKPEVWVYCMVKKV